MSDSTINMIAGLLSSFIILGSITLIFLIPSCLIILYRTPNLKNFRIEKVTIGDEDRYIILAKNRLGFWRLITDLCNHGEFKVSDRLYKNYVSVLKYYYNEDSAIVSLNEIVVKINASNELKKRSKVVKKGDIIKEVNL